VAERRKVVRLPGTLAVAAVGSVAAKRIRCVAGFDGGVVVGTSDAHLMVVDADGGRLLDDFESVPGRAAWYTPWGGAPSVRSLDQGPDGLRWVSVHVGGVLVGDGAAWRQTMEIDNDVHQVVAHPDREGVALAAAAVGLGVTDDGGAAWQWITDGLDSPYARAVAVSGDVVLVTVSRGPSGGDAAVYRGEIGGPLRRCTERFDGNIDTGWLSASGSHAAFATPDGLVMVSSDVGDTWEEAFAVSRPRGVAHAVLT
jgi:hypothetical protein